MITVTADAFGQLIEVGKDNNSATVRVVVRDTRAGLSWATTAIDVLGSATRLPVTKS